MYQCSLIFLHVLIVLLSIIPQSLFEKPLTTCASSRPFRTSNGCFDFNEICVKNADNDCIRFLEVCKQCPASNFTNIVLLNIQDELKFQKADHLQLLRQLASKKEVPPDQSICKTDSILVLLTVILVINILLILLLILEIRFKLITKCLESKPKKEYRKKYRLIKNQSVNERTFNSEVNYNTILNKLDPKLTKILEILINQKFNNNDSLTIFKLEGIDEPITLEINENDCVIRIKQLLLEKLPQNNGMYNLKTLKLKYLGQDLDNNQFLMPRLPSSNVTLFGYCDRKLSTKDLILLKLRGNCKLPELIQINKNNKIQEIKDIIIREIHSDDFVLLHKKETVAADNDFQDNDLIEVVVKEQKIFEVKSIFNDKEVIEIRCSNMVKISDLYRIFTNKFGGSSENVILFLDYEVLTKEKFIYQLKNESENQIKFCYFMKEETLELKEPIILGETSQIYITEDPVNKTKMILKKYNLNYEELLKPNSYLIKELITFQITKSNPIFVKLLGVYKAEGSFLVAMENIINKSIKEYVSKSGTQSEEIIAKWSIQILEGLQFLHKNGIIHRDLKPTNIFLDESNNIKLSGFDISKYIKDCDSEELAKGFNHTKIGTYRYMAPEVLKDEGYGSQVDVWSFGIILIEIITNQPIFPDMTEVDVISKICESNKIDWEPYPHTSKTLVDLINSCLDYDPKKRPTVETLLNHDFLKTYRYKN